MNYVRDFYYMYFNMYIIVSRCSLSSGDLHLSLCLWGRFICSSKCSRHHSDNFKLITGSCMCLSLNGIHVLSTLAIFLTCQLHLAVVYFLDSKRESIGVNVTLVLMILGAFVAAL